MCECVCVSVCVCLCAFVYSCTFHEILHIVAWGENGHSNSFFCKKIFLPVHYAEYRCRNQVRFQVKAEKIRKNENCQFNWRKECDRWRSTSSYLIQFTDQNLRVWCDAVINLYPNIMSGSASVHKRRKSTAGWRGRICTIKENCLDCVEWKVSSWYLRMPWDGVEIQ